MHSHCELNRGGASDEDAERVRKVSLFGTNPRVMWQLLFVAEEYNLPFDNARNPRDDISVSGRILQV